MNEEERKYLENKHRGGESNRKGNLYEVYYAVFSILREKSLGHGEAMVSSQVEGAYVDDLLIDDGEHKTYHQLKNKKTVSWGGKKHGDLHYDFVMQAKQCKDRSENFFLKLVVAQESQKPALYKEMPKELKENSSVEFYPIYPYFNQYVYDSTFTKIAINAIGCEPYELDKVGNVSTALLGLWTRSQYTEMKVDDVWRDMNHMLFGEEDSDATMVDALCIQMIKMGFTVQLGTGVLNWKRGGFAGSLRLSNPKMRSLLSLTDEMEMIQNLI